MPSENTSSRKLAAILFADIAGYTALMQKDENKASTLLRRFQTCLKSEVAAHHGEVVNFYGDGALCTFNSPLEAMQCAIKLQSNFQTEPKVPVRIGIHSGTVVYEGDKVFGDSVNVASRIESMGIPGSILVSKKVRNELKNQPDLLLPSLGSFEFKNVDEPMEVFALANEGFVVPKREEMKGKVIEKTTSSKNRFWIIGAALVFLISLLVYQFGFRTDDAIKTENIESPYQNSIVVLPFENIGGDPEQDFFGPGIAGEILVSLAQIKALKVIGRTTAFSYKGQDDFKIIGKELDVKNVLDGTVRKSGDQLRVTAQLTNVENGAVLWTSRFDRTFQDIFVIQDEIANEVVKGLKIELSVDEQRRMDKRYTENVDAYAMYLKVWEEFNRGTEESLKNSEILADEILQIDSNYAPALSIKAGYAGIRDLESGYKYVDKALAIDPELGVAHMNKGVLQFYKEWKFLEAEESLLKASAYGEVRALAYLMFLYIKTENYERAFEIGERYRELDPIEYELWNNLLGLLAFFKTGKTSAAIEVADNIFHSASHPDYLGKAGKIYLNSGLIDKAIFTLQKGINRGAINFNQAIQSDLGIAYYKKGDLAKSDSLLNVLKDKYQVPGFNGSAFHAAQIHSARGEVDSTFLWLEKAYEAKEIEMIWLKIEPAFEPLHDDPRYSEMLDRVGFPKILKN